MNDKLKHFIAGALITLLVLIAFIFIPHGDMYNWDKGIALALGCLAGVAKEVIWDKWLHKGTPDFYDFLATVYGAFAAMFSWVIIETIITNIK